MTRTFICRGFDGYCHEVSGNWWLASVQVTDSFAEDIWVSASGPTKSAAICRVRRKLDAVERAFKERGFR